MGNPRILISSSSPLLRRDGTSVRAIRAFKALQSEFDTQMLTLEEKGAAASENPAMRMTVLRPRRRSLWPFHLMRFLLGNRFDIILCENDWRWLPVLVLLSRIRGYKIVFEAHGVFSLEMIEMGSGRANEKFNRLREKILLPRCDLVIALSQDIESFYRRHSKRIEIVRVFVDDIRPNTARRGTSPLESKSVGIIGPFDASRNKSGLEFLEQNIDRFPNSIQFVVIGKCSNRIEHPRIRFTGFIESIDEYNKAISDLDAVLVVERTATSGPLNKILEPMRHGVPVFTNPKGLIGLDFAKDGVNVFVAEDNDLPDVVGKTISDKDLMKRIGESGRELVENHYSYEKESKKLVAAITELTRSNERPS